MMFNIPGQSVTKKRGLYAGLFDKFNASADEQITDEQKASLFRKGLLSFGLNSLATKGQGFGGSMAEGLRGGLMAMDDGAQQIGNDRYKNEILARTRAGMERNTAIEQAQAGILNPDGTLNEAKWGEYAALDPEGALAIKEKVTPQGRKNPGQPVYFTSADGQYEDPYVWDQDAGGYVPAQQFMGGGQAPQMAAP